LSSLELDALSQVAVVLMRTSHPGNIGGAGRAMKTMGLSDLRLVSPKNFPCDEAYRRSSGAEDVLIKAQVCDSLEDAIKDCHIVIGASARSRKMAWPLMNPRDCSELVVNAISSRQIAGQTKVALLFGQEASGLSNEELQRCNYHVNIPANAEYSSLNLSMAVQVICYEIRMSLLYRGYSESAAAARLSALSPQLGNWDVDLASSDDVERFFEHLEETLIKIEFHDPKNPRMLMTRLRRLIQRAHMDKMEVNIMRGIMTAIQKKII